MRKIDELNEKHELYEQYKEDWELYNLIYRSGKDLIDYAIKRHPRESSDNYSARLDDGYVFNFGKAIIDLFNFYLCQKEAVRTLKGLEKNPLWEMFLKDADLHGTDYNVLIDQAQKLASALGSIGILVNKPDGGVTVDQNIKLGVYPYYALYNPLNIYDWQWEKDPITHRDVLVRLKLREVNGDWLLWWPEKWEIWTIPDTGHKTPRLKDEGENPLGEIPFIWMVNLKDLEHPEIGCSDLVDIAHIVVSIAQNLSCGEEMIKLAGFPIRRQPMEPEGQEGEDQVETGPRAVEEFNPELGDGGKPDWMPTEILEPVEAALKWIDRKTDEIYRIAHMSGVHGQRKSNNEVASGLAVRYEFSQLNSVLIAKSVNQTEAELQALRLWLKWQNTEDIFKNMEIFRKQEFSIDELSVALDNAIRAHNNVLSQTFRKRVQEKVVKHILPDLSQDDQDTIKTEIDTNTPEKVELIESTKGKTTSVRSGLEARADHGNDEPMS